MAESEELKNLLMTVKEKREKSGMELNIQKTKIMAFSPITSWQIVGETMETVTNFIFGEFQNHCRWWKVKNYLNMVISEIIKDEALSTITYLNSKV